MTNADIIEMTFTGAFTLVGGSGGVNANSDAIVPGIFDGSTGFDGVGSRTQISGYATYDTVTGAGNGNINSFSFFGAGLIEFQPYSLFQFQAIGDGMGNTEGTLLAADVGFYWGSQFVIPATIIIDATGFFNSIGAAGSSWTIETGCAGCATSATPDTLFGSAVGAVPMAMTTFNTAGTTLGSIFPLSNGDIAGSPMTTAPFPGQNMAFDFTTINATNTSVVPVPSAVWLFASGLLGLTGIARRRRDVFKQINLRRNK